ncbi:hypothetical protein Q0M94_08860 [Deinococcus radiomollis]|uniref:hypothetical protein n=1 Tax=Deinococcus radiomollis TaxID=468916 RepID=UPI00389128BE
MLAHSKLHPAHVCAYNGGEWHSDVVAFPAGRADRMYTFNDGAASAYQIRSGQARLVWCGQATDVPLNLWKPASNVLRVLIFPSVRPPERYSARVPWTCFSGSPAT